MRAEAYVIIAIAIIAILIFAFSQKPTITGGEAVRFVLDDMRATYKGADIYEILSVENVGGSWKIAGRISGASTSPCPSRLHIFYDYPRFGFATREEPITKGCTVCKNELNCTLLFEEEAIIASHTFDDTEAIRDYIDRFPDARASAKFYDAFTLNGTVYENAWVVEWNSSRAGFAQGIVLNKLGGTSAASFTE